MPELGTLRQATVLCAAAHPDTTVPLIGLDLPAPERYSALDRVSLLRSTNARAGKRSRWVIMDGPIGPFGHSLACPRRPFLHQ
jgi:hypothetical protein